MKSGRVSLAATLMLLVVVVTAMAESVPPLQVATFSQTIIIGDVSMQVPEGWNAPESSRLKLPGRYGSVVILDGKAIGSSGSVIAVDITPLPTTGQGGKVPMSIDNAAKAYADGIRIPQEAAGKSSGGPKGAEIESVRTMVTVAGRVVAYAFKEPASSKSSDKTPRSSFVLSKILDLDRMVTIRMSTPTQVELLTLPTMLAVIGSMTIREGTGTADSVKTSTVSTSAAGATVPGVPPRAGCAEKKCDGNCGGK